MNTYIQQIKNKLVKVSTAAKAESARRYFPSGIHCIGANAADIKTIIKEFHQETPELSAEEVLQITEGLLACSEYSEERMIAFGLINKFVKRHYDDSLLLRFEYWLETYANNWALVDDLCIKTIYTFLSSRPHLIVTTQHWAQSSVPWCRRASNVVWVKFIKRKLGHTTYWLDTRLVFMNCDYLLGDKDEFVQKSVGWLLKVTLPHYEREVLVYLRKNHRLMWRSTIRYALEKLDKPSRKTLLLEFKTAETAL